MKYVSYSFRKAMTLKAKVQQLQWDNLNSASNQQCWQLDGKLCILLLFCLYIRVVQTSLHLLVFVFRKKTKKQTNYLLERTNGKDMQSNQLIIT